MGVSFMENLFPFVEGYFQGAKIAMVFYLPYLVFCILQKLLYLCSELKKFIY